MDMKQIKELIAAMEKNGLKRIRIKEEKGYELELESHPDHPPVIHTKAPESAHHYFAPAASSPSQSDSEMSKSPVQGECISSPMVGTFYSAASPDDPAYVKVGDVVEEDTVVCIIEAMKVMNEVKSGKKGKIVEILLDNADPVEFGTNIFRIV